MLKKSLLIMLLAALFTPLAMQAQVLMEAPRALNHQQVVKQAPQTRAAGWLQYDDGTIATNLGSGSAAYWTFGPMYPSSMLGNNNTLSKVSFYETSYMITDVTISIYSGGDTEPGTLLYTEDVTPSGNSGFHEVELAEAVTIDPTQNLWIITRVGGTYPMPLCQSTEANNDWVNNGGWGHLSTMWQSGYGFMIRGYVEYVDPSACPKPTQLTTTNITTNSATLSWNSDASSCQLVYSNNSSFNPDSATPTNVTGNTHTLTGLSDGTTYYVYVRANCDGSYSDWSSTSFTTVSACATPYNVAVSDIAPFSANISWDGWQNSYTMRYMVPSFYDGFENNLEGWTVYTQGTAPQTDGWYAYDATNLENGTNHTGDYVASSWSWSSTAYNANNYLVTPQVALGGTLLFWEYTNAGYPDSYEVLLSTSGNAISNFTVTLRSMQQASIDGWHLVTIDLSAYSGRQGYIAIHHVDYDMNYLFIDDFCIGTWTTVSNVSSPYAFTGLTPETTYVAQIQGTCPSGTTEWSDGVVIPTPSACQTPFDLASANVTGSAATLSWDGYQNSYNIQYRTASYREIYFFDDFENGEGDWINDGGIYYFTGETNHFVLLGYTDTNTQYLITPELPNYAAGSTVEFEYRINGTETTFMVGYSSTTSDESAFTWGSEIAATTNDITVFSEVIPTGTKYIAIQTTGVAFIVDNFGIYDPTVVPAGNWVTVNNVTSPYTLSGLAAEKKYEWQVQGVNTSCNGGVTEWSESDFFTTIQLCPAPADLTVSNVTSTTAVVTWSSDASMFTIKLNDELVERGYLDTIYTFEGLEPGTLNTVEIQSDCGTDGASEWASISFYTECSAFNLPYEYSFDDILNDDSEFICWDALTSSSENNYGFYYADATQTDIMFAFSSWNQADYYTQALISPELNAPDGVTVEFDYKPYMEQYGEESFMVGYSTTTKDISEFTWGDEVTANDSTQWAQYSETFPAGTKYVCVIYLSQYVARLYLNNFSFTEPQASVTTQTIELSTGWNWCAFNVETNLNDLQNALVNALPGSNDIKISSQTQTSTYNGRTWRPSLGELDLTQMYQIKVNADCEITLEGDRVDPTTPITIESGNNYIAFPLTEGMTSTDAFDGFAISGDKIQTQLTSSTFNGRAWRPVVTLTPGEGLIYNSSTTGTRTLVFPRSSKSSRGIRIDAPLKSIKKMGVSDINTLPTKK